MSAPDRPIPLPPRTPTPPPEDGLAGFSNSPTKSVHDSNALTPMDENFPMRRNASIPSFVTTTVHLAENDANTLHTPASIDSHDGAKVIEPRKSSTLMVEDANGVFNFQPSSMAKASVTAKSVGHLSPRFIPSDKVTLLTSLLNRT